jgi:uncharacterized membrane protein
MGLFMFIGACWLPVVWIQIRIRELAARGAARGDYRKLMQTWTILGAVALAAILVLFFLMASRLGAYS